jgi:FAD:protein FMN transferase
MFDTISRRRAITIIAIGAALSLKPWPLAGKSAERLSPLYRWRGRALGAEATLLFDDQEGSELSGDHLAELCVAEIERLEQIFSLFRESSELSRLNRQGSLDDPTYDLVQIFQESFKYSALSGGAFDVSVQPLWALYGKHFARPDADPNGPDADALDRARKLVNYRAIDLGDKRIAFRRPGMAVTLNGIAQGYIADRISDILRQNGVENVLVNMGEYRALGHHPSGRPWRVGLADPTDLENLTRSLSLTDRAVASSGGYGTVFDKSGRHHHLFDPSSGKSANHLLGVSVIAETATIADALSTALSVLPIDKIQECLDRVGSVRAIVTMQDGAKKEYSAAKKKSKMPG